MMATAVNFNKAHLLDLSFLTAEERAKLEAVIKADQTLLLRDRVRVGTLRQQLEQERHHQKRLLDKPQCTYCEKQLGVIFNSGSPCPSCSYRICKQCRVISQNPPPPFLCPVCVKKRVLDIQAADYTSIPSSNFSPAPPFGSQLVMMSLEATCPAEPTMVNPYDGKARRTLFSQGRSRSGTNESSGTTPSFERGDSVKSDDSATSRRERPNSLPARKVSPSEFSDSEEENEPKGLEVPGVSRLRNSESISSIGSLTSMYSAAGGKGNYAISGEICIGIWYSNNGLLMVHIEKARNLAAARKEGHSYPYVKVYLLPDRSKQTKRKTGFMRKTVNPRYDETFKYKLDESELSSRTVWLSVWDWDRFGRNQFLGELRLPLKDLDLTDDNGRWYTLQDQDESARLEVETQYRGRLKLGLMFVLDPEPPSIHPHKRRKKSKKGVLHVAIKQAEDLPKMDIISLTDAVVKCYLLPSRMSSSKRKTQVVMNSLAPVWNEEFVYKASLKELTGERVLEVTVWDYDKRGSNDFIGGLRLGPKPSGTPHVEWMDSIGEEAAHWEAVLARPGEWVEQWHTLRPKMDHVTVLPQKPPSLGRELSPVDEGQSPTGEEGEETKAPPHDTTNDSIISQSPFHSHSPSPIPELLVTSEADKIPRSTSTGSIRSAYSEGETGRGNYEITGEIQVGFMYRRGQLLIHVNRARGLAAADSNGYSDPYVKTYLLPDRSKHSKRKTAVQKKTLNPIFDEKLEYSVAEAELSSRTVWLTVWDKDTFAPNQFLGEVRLPLKDLDLRSETELWYTLVDKDQPYHLLPNSGQFQLALKFAPKETVGGTTRGTLSVQIKHASNLSGTDGTGQLDTYVECSLLPDSSTSGKRKTAVKTSDTPSWGETFFFEKVALEEIASGRVLEVTVLNSNQDNSPDIIGGLRIGPRPSGTSQDKEWIDSIKEEAEHWETMLAHPGEWAEQWHMLRRTMQPRKIDYSTLQNSDVATPTDDEFRKIVPKSSSGSPHMSSSRPPLPPSTSKQQPMQRSSPVLSRKPIKKQLPETEPGSHSTRMRSASPLVSSNSSRSASPNIPLGDISKVPLHSRSESPEVASDVPLANQKLPSGPLKRAGLLGLSHAGSHSSFGSQLSVYSSAGGGKGNYTITGEVLIGISYSGGQLLIHVNRARGLAAADSNGYSDPYVKTYLLPDRSKHSKRKTAVQRKTLEPVYNETLVYKLAASELPSRTLWLSVWDWDRFGRNQFLGELRLPLKDLNLEDSGDYWHALQDKDDDPEDVDFYRGQLSLALRYSPTGTKKGKTHGSLQIIIKRGRDFPSLGGSEKPDPVVKCYLLPDKSSSGKRKVGIIKNQKNPVWEEQISYEKVILEEIVTERVLEVTVWDWDKKGSSFIGGLRIGPTPSKKSQNKEWMDSIGEEAGHWEAMLARPGEWVEKWHTLRTTMDPRNVAFQ